MRQWKGNFIINKVGHLITCLCFVTRVKALPAKILAPDTALTVAVGGGRREKVIHRLAQVSPH